MCNTNVEEHACAVVANGSSLSCSDKPCVIYLQESHCPELLEVTWTHMRDSSLCKAAAQSLLSSLKNHRLNCSMWWSHCVRSKTRGTIERACEECRKWNWSDMCMKTGCRKEAMVENHLPSFFGHTDEDVTLREASLWHSGHEFKTRDNF